MVKSLEELLIYLNNKYPENTTVKQLQSEGFSDSVIFQAISGDLIGPGHDFGMKDKNKEYILGLIKRDSTQFVVIFSNGFIMLNQILLKKATDELNTSIYNFDSSSKKLSWIIIMLTVAMLLLTGFIAWLTWKLTNTI